VAILIAPEQGGTAPDQGGIVLADTRQRSETTPEGPAGTWNAFKQIDERTRIDFIFTRPERPRVLAHRTEDPKTPAGRFASDHLPVIAIIEFGPRREDQ
jgi:endonuclease/exonuclease/phosphatase family metal-dependent hydrolase